MEALGVCKQGVCKICSKLTINTPVLASLLLTLNVFTPCSSVSIVNLEQVNAGWVLHVCGGPGATLQHQLTCFYTSEVAFQKLF